MYLNVGYAGMLASVQQKLSKQIQDPDLLLIFENAFEEGLSGCMCAKNVVSEPKKVVFRNMKLIFIGTVSRNPYIKQW